MISALVALSQLVLGLTLAVDPPSWIKELGNQKKSGSGNLGRKEIETKVSKIERKLWKTDAINRDRDRDGDQNEESVGLLQEDELDRNGIEPSTSSSSSQLKISEVLSIAFFKTNNTQVTSERSNGREENPYRKGLCLILFTQIAQQFGGVNAVLYFSTGILTNVLSDGKGGDGKGLTIGAKEVGVVITVSGLTNEKKKLSKELILTLSPLFILYSLEHLR